MNPVACQNLYSLDRTGQVAPVLLEEEEEEKEEKKEFAQNTLPLKIEISEEDYDLIDFDDRSTTWSREKDGQFTKDFSAEFDEGPDNIKQNFPNHASEEYNRYEEEIANKREFKKIHGIGPNWHPSDASRYWPDSKVVLEKLSLWLNLKLYQEHTERSYDSFEDEWLSTALGWFMLQLTKLWMAQYKNRYKKLTKVQQGKLRDLTVKFQNKYENFLETAYFEDDKETAEREKKELEEAEARGPRVQCAQQ